MKSVWWAREREEVYFPHPGDPNLIFSVTMQDGQLIVTGFHATQGPAEIEAVTLASGTLLIKLERQPEKAE